MKFFTLVFVACVLIVGAELANAEEVPPLPWQAQNVCYNCIVGADETPDTPVVSVDEQREVAGQVCCKRCPVRRLFRRLRRR